MRVAVQLHLPADYDGGLQCAEGRHVAGRWVGSCHRDSGEAGWRLAKVVEGLQDETATEHG